jgi:hypothetical protein
MQLGVHGVEEQRRLRWRMSRSRLLGAGRGRQRQQGKHCDYGCEEEETGRPALDRG